MLVVFAKGVRIIPPTKIQKPKTIGQKIAKFQKRSISSVVREWNIDGQIRMNKRGSLTELGKTELVKRKLQLGLFKNATVAQYCEASSIDLTRRLQEALKETEILREQQRLAAMQPHSSFVITI